MISHDIRPSSCVVFFSKAEKLFHWDEQNIFAIWEVLTKKVFNFRFFVSQTYVTAKVFRLSFVTP